MDDLLHRVTDAISFLKEELPFRVGELYFHCNGNRLRINGSSESIAFENITQRSALAELNEIKELFLYLTNLSEDFKTFVSTKELVFTLFLVAGMGDMGICSEMDNIVTWHFPLRIE